MWLARTLCLQNCINLARLGYSFVSYPSCRNSILELVGECRRQHKLGNSNQINLYVAIFQSEPVRLVHHTSWCWCHCYHYVITLRHAMQPDTAGSQLENFFNKGEEFSLIRQIRLVSVSGGARADSLWHTPGKVLSVNWIQWVVRLNQWCVMATQCSHQVGRGLGAQSKV